MPNQSERTKLMSFRIPNEQFAFLDTYSAGKKINRSEALLYFLSAGIKAEANTQAPATSAEITALRAELQNSFSAMAKAIEKQPIQVQAPPSLESVEQKTTRWQRLKKAWFAG